MTEKINVLVDKAERAGCEGDVEEAQGVLKLCDQFREEREDLKKQIGKLMISTLTIHIVDSYFHLSF